MLILFRNVLAEADPFPQEECGLADGGGGVRSATGRGRTGDGNSNDGRGTRTTSPAAATAAVEAEEGEEAEEEEAEEAEEEAEEEAILAVGDCNLNGDEGFDSLGGRGGGFDTVELQLNDEPEDPMIGDGSCDGFR